MTAAARSTSIQTKLLGALGLGLLIILACALAGLASAWLNLNSEMPREVAQQAQSEKLGREFRMQVQEWKNVLLRGRDEGLRKKHLTAFDEKSRDVEKIAAQLAKSPDPAAARLARQFADQHRALDASYHASLVRFAEAGYDGEAGDILVRGMDRPLGATLEKLMDASRGLAEAAIAAKTHRAQRMLVIAGVAMVAASLVLLALISLWLRRSVVAPIMEVAAIARGVANGDLSRTIRISTRDEIGELAGAMQRMTGTLQQVITAQAEMARHHDEGRISFRIDEEAFSGEYSRMVRGANAMVAQHIDVTLRIIDVMQRYAVGDLSQDMDRLPGEKAAITEAMDTTKASLSSINGEIRRLAEAAGRGDFSKRGDTARYQYEFAEMIDGLNRLMDTTGQSLSALSALLRAIAQGDLTHRMEGDFHGVFAQMRDDANTSVSQLTDIIGRIQEAASSINMAAAEIASGNDDLSRRTEQQAASLEETAASMEELTSTVKQNADNARQANQLAQGAAGVAAQGGKVVEEVVTTMGSIEASSKKIADIIGVIDGIAFQTNILALNAAVEAARAGEQGRGFAVVAGEVRALAQRSASAAKEIKLLIDESVGKVSDGALLVRQAGDTMGEIVGSVQRVTDIMADISTASQEQSSGIEQINQTVTQMDEATQQNAALVEQATAAARLMEEQAASLEQATNMFRLNRRQAMPRAA